MSSGERPIGAAKGKQSDTEALCQPPPPPPPQAYICKYPPACRFSLYGTQPLTWPKDTKLFVVAVQCLYVSLKLFG